MKFIRSLFSRARTLCVFCAAILFFCKPAPAQQQPLRGNIVAITFNGNRTTKEATLRMFLANIGIDRGRVFDTLKIADAKRKLLCTNLFSKVEILCTPQEGGVHLSVIVEEIFYFNANASLEQYQPNYGNPWWKLYMGFSEANFRGRMETFSVKLSAWEDRGIGLSWSKPLLPSPYYISLGASAEYYPELDYPRTRLVIPARITIGRELSTHSTAFAGFLPTYTQIDSMYGDMEKDLKEAFIAVGCAIDFRDNNFDPSTGWYFCNDFTTNAAYSNDSVKYGQYDAEFRCYVPGFFPKNVIACRITATFRTNDAGSYRSLYAGGPGSVRGYPTDALGQNGVMNDRIVFSSEYRFAILSTPVIAMPLIPEQMAQFRSLSFQLDGALIADAGHLWHEFSKPQDSVQNAAGFGAGIKIAVPKLRRSGCIDLVWPVMPDPQSGELKMYQPEVHIYLDAFY